MPVKISDIAKKVGVAKTTVSLVLNRKRSQVRISKETERKILDAAKELNYSPSFAARALARGKTRTIGILVSSIDNNFYAAFFKYLNDVCYRSGYSVFITSSEFDLGRERRNLEFFLNRLADGVIITRSANQNDDLIQKIVDLGIPVILEGEMGPTPYPLVTIDEFKVAELAAEHIWSLGHRKINRRRHVAQPSGRSRGVTRPVGAGGRGEPGDYLASGPAGH
jgi:DNA-binding LacI/PurR family transcriptional regulator